MLEQINRYTIKQINNLQQSSTIYLTQRSQRKRKYARADKQIHELTNQQSSTIYLTQRSQRKRKYARADKQIHELTNKQSLPNQQS